MRRASCDAGVDAYALLVFPRNPYLVIKAHVGEVNVVQIRWVLRFSAVLYKCRLEDADVLPQACILATSQCIFPMLTTGNLGAHWSSSGVFFSSGVGKLMTKRIIACLVT